VRSHGWPGRRTRPVRICSWRRSRRSNKAVRVRQGASRSTCKPAFCSRTGGGSRAGVHVRAENHRHPVRAAFTAGCDRRPGTSFRRPPPLRPSHRPAPAPHQVQQRPRRPLRLRRGGWRGRAPARLRRQARDLVETLGMTRTDQQPRAGNRPADLAEGIQQQLFPRRGGSSRRRSSGRRPPDPAGRPGPPGRPGVSGSCARSSLQLPVTAMRPGSMPSSAKRPRPRRSGRRRRPAPPAPGPGTP